MWLAVVPFYYPKLPTENKVLKLFLFERILSAIDPEKTKSTVKGKRAIPIIFLDPRFKKATYFKSTKSKFVHGRG